jgi:hypothetical protein
MQYRLRSLLILLAVTPMLIGGSVNLVNRVLEARERARNMPCGNGCKGQLVNGKFIPSIRRP